MENINTKFFPLYRIKGGIFSFIPNERKNSPKIMKMMVKKNFDGTNKTKNNQF